LAIATVSSWCDRTRRQSKFSTGGFVEVILNSELPEKRSLSPRTASFSLERNTRRIFLDAVAIAMGVLDCKILLLWSESVTDIL
jgi:hypothetical protein